MIPAKKENCRDELVQRILTLEIAPGCLLDEAALSEEFGLSRTPLREVYQSLAGDGYLSISRNRGAKVSSMDLESMRNFFQTAPMIYSAVGRLATENANAQQVVDLKETQQRFRKVCEGGETREMAIFNHRFHEIIGEMAGSVYLTPSLRRLLVDHTRMSQKFYKPINSKERLLVWEACDQHDEMISAIEEHDQEVMVSLTLEHWELSRNQIEKFSRPDPLEFDLEKAG